MAESKAVYLATRDPGSDAFHILGVFSTAAGARAYLDSYRKWYVGEYGERAAEWLEMDVEEWEVDPPHKPEPAIERAGPGA